VIKRKNESDRNICTGKASKLKIGVKDFRANEQGKLVGKNLIDEKG
jgi:hypothetical protein